MIEVRSLTVGPVQENCYVVAPQGGDRAVVFDPGEEAPRILQTIADMGVEVEAILLTHCHFDHVGAVAALARETHAPVYCPKLERDILAHINDYVRWPGFGPFEEYEADELVEGGERLTLAGLDFDIFFTPGHSPGHVTWSLADERALFSGDVLFQSSIGRTDLPGGDHARLLQSIAELMQALPDDTVVHPGHMGLTTLGAERATNPFLAELA